MILSASAGATAGDYAGSAACAPCHAGQQSAWMSSLHADAMRPAGTGTSAPFAGEKAAFGKDGGGSVRFLRSAGKHTAEVIEAGSDPQTLAVPYAFGRRPMEQFLGAADKGRLQALPVAYDTTRREWFDIFSGEERLPGEFGHWTGRGMNANSQCTACHATNYRAGYDEASGVYASTWSETGVGCEACHGPGAAHVDDPKQPYGPFGSGSALANHLPKPPAAATAAATTDAGTAASAASPPPPAAAAAMLDVCASCHSVRRPIAEGFAPGAKLLDHFEPSLLDEDLYHADGAVASEAYEWGSFVQSRMYAAGVTCLACHDVHSGELKAKGNDLCLSCHPTSLASKTHTAHEEGTPASACVSCHMPGATFMARDHRRDHALSIPDPIGAKETGSPSACETCHGDRGREALAADAARLWPRLLEASAATRRAVAQAFADARAARPAAAEALRLCIQGQTCQTPILRASAARLTERVPLDAKLAGVLLEALEDGDPLVRSAAAYALADADPRELMLRQYLMAAATDPVRAVRINAAWALRRLDTDRLSADQAASMHRAYAEWRASTMLLADSPESWHTLGVFETARRDVGAAEAAYRRAIAMEPRATPTRHNLAMLLVDTGRIDEARKEFEELVAIDDSEAASWHALGLLYGEQQNWKEAARALGRCLKLDPARPGVLPDLTHAYLEAGVANVARSVLQGALEFAPTRREALAGLVTVAVRTGDQAEAARAAAALVAEDPSASADPEVARLVADAAAGASAAPAPAP